ncbi:Cof-type HAD-IIB family hydrolase [Clostridium sp. NSJ-49]|uniref:Cof family hydrolase n=1 Tax=Clostridium disporicum TaxID=84024 RepID=A0A174E2A6_9CLOT|nr:MULTISPECIES: Cof-type HAD-IIB family hydrolase [Clostridium]MBC5625870.1 Cof-type HAD-IIB family hydrolase [Clostridium sp. NSJ-49]MCD2500345.1 HAD family hydrolase [Clostridium sp. NSJ-145]MDU6340997.1 Cof-type HAD-IIB family hydrolase [Clostridium sp.]CUO32022.1 cof family hydrolase [Clostridium disporicum]
MKLLACDLDGTLVETEKNFIRKDNIEAIKKLRKEGHKFIVSTGRDIKGIKSIFKDNKEIEFDYLVLCNGALILDNNFNQIYKNTLPHNVVKSVYDDIYKNNSHKDAAMYVTYENTSSIFYTGCNKEFKDFLGTFENINNEDEVFSKEREYNLISIFSKSSNNDNAEKLKEQLLDTFGESYGIFRNQAFVDMVGKDCSKGSGLKKIIEIENWDANNLYTIGDSYNDISMFNITDNSFTFNHVEDGVKAHANHTVDFVHECIDIILNS